VVVGVVGAVTGAFLCAGGWFSPARLTPNAMVDTFERVNGAHEGFRRNHAKGLGVSGWFESNGRAARLSHAVVFRPGRVPVVGRFAIAGGMPDAADGVKSVRSLALAFTLPNGEEWRTGMNALPVFAARTAEAFRDQLLAMAPDPRSGKPDPAKLSAFLATYPESGRAIQRIRSEPPTAGFSDSTYRSLNAFVLTDDAGHTTNVRWALVPDQPKTPPAAAPAGKNFLFDAVISSIHTSPLRFHLVLTLGQPGDPTDDATVEWPSDREQLDSGTVTLDHVESEATSPARSINFDPLVLPSGIAGSDDPLLSARSAAYSVSFRRRQSEPVMPSAVTPAEVQGEAIR
jgi:catalase